LSSQLSQQPLCRQFLHSNLSKFSCFFTWIPLENSEVLFRVGSWRCTTIIVVIISVREVGDNKGEKQLLITNGKGEFEQDVCVLGNNFRTKYEQFLEVYNF
jgi:hypothetical protein